MIPFKNTSKQNKSPKNDLPAHSNSSDNKKILNRKLFISYYLRFHEPFSKLCVFFSIIHQIMVMKILENQNTTDEEAYQKIDFFFTAEIIIAHLMTLDCICKLALPHNFLYSQNYGLFFLLIDCISGPVALGHDLYFILIMEQFSILGFILRFAKIFTFLEIRKILQRLAKMTLKIFPLFFTLFSIFYIFSYIAKSMYNKDAPQYFGTLSGSMFTMFQILTLDSWGVIGRSILQLNGMISALYLAVFVFIMTYFFLNILIGFIVDNMSPSEDEEDNKKDLKATHLYSSNGNHENTKYNNFLIGKYYDIIVFVFFLLSLLEVYTFVNSSSLDNESKWFVHLCAFILEFSTGIIYTLHFFAIVVLKIKSKRANQSNNHSNVEGIFFAIHFFAGPIAFIFDVYQYAYYSYIKFGHFLRIFKILSIGSNRKFILTYFKIIPKLMSTFCALFGFTVLLAFWATEKFRYLMPDYFANLNLSVYSFIQILTMDDWCAGIARNLIRNTQESALPFVLFIFLANYILLNIMLAISCDQMKEVSHQQKIFEGECETFSTYSSQISYNNKYVVIKHPMSRSLLNILKLIEFNHSFYYSKLTNSEKIQDFIKPEANCVDRQSEVELHFLLKELRKSSKEGNLNDNIIIEFKGKTHKIKSKKVLFQISSNVELIYYSKNTQMADKFSKTLSEEMKSLLSPKKTNEEKQEEKNIDDDILENETEKLIK